MNRDQLKLGKGSAFVKSKLSRLPQEDVIWEVDFRPEPCPDGGPHGYLGIVISQRKDLVREVTVYDEPTVNDLAGLLAQSMRSPFEGLAHRPRVVRLTSNPAWTALIPQLVQIGVEVQFVGRLPGIEAAFKELDSEPEPVKRPKKLPIFQFKVTLRDSNPPIWRRIQLKNGPLDRLHEAIQTAMGWTNSHLHHFRLPGGMYGDPELVGEDAADIDYQDSTAAKLIDLFPPQSHQVFEYEYDFGDSWYHDVEFEGHVPAAKGDKYPRCIEGARRCPPEDVGGIVGYEDFCLAMKNRRHPRHKELREWIGEPIDPEEFDPEIATGRMQRGLLDWRRSRR